jgi:hypothetical protein
MKYIKRISTVFIAIAFFVSLFTITSSAQVRGRVSIGNRAGVRPVARRVYVRPYYNGFYNRGFGWGGGYWGDPFWGGSSIWNDPYYTNPRLRALADRQYAEDQVRSKRKDIRKYNEKIREDGEITAKEQEKLAKKQREYDKRVQKLEDADY